MMPRRSSRVTRETLFTNIMLMGVALNWVKKLMRISRVAQALVELWLIKKFKSFSNSVFILRARLDIFVLCLQTVRVSRRRVKLGGKLYSHNV